MRFIALLGWLLLAPLAAQAAAVDPDPLADPQQEALAQSVMKEVRCLVCRNQSIEDSNADMAADLRRLVRERVAAGDDAEAVKAYLVARYGDWVLLQPPLRGTTLLLWLTPVLVVAIGALVLLRRFRRQPLAAPEALDADEAAALRQLERDR